MTTDEQDPPVHRMSGAEERERLLAATLAHADVQEAQYRLPPAAHAPKSHWKAPTALFILVIAALSLAFPPGWVQAPARPAIEQGNLERGVRAAVYLQAQQIEAFRAREGGLPQDLTELPVRIPGVRFIRSNNRVYQLVARRPGGENLVYDSARPAAGIEAVADTWFDRPAPSS